MEKSGSILLILGAAMSPAVAGDLASKTSVSMLDLPTLSDRAEWATAPIRDPLPDFSDLATDRDQVSDVGLRDIEFDGAGSDSLETAPWPVDAAGPSTNARFGLGASSGSAAGDAGAFDAEVNKTTAVPLPTAGLLGAAGLVVIGTRRRR